MKDKTTNNKVKTVLLAVAIAALAIAVGAITAAVTSEQTTTTSGTTSGDHKINVATDAVNGVKQITITKAL